MSDRMFLVLWGLGMVGLVLWMVRERKTAGRLPPMPPTAHLVITHELRPIPYVPEPQPLPAWLASPEVEMDRPAYCPACLLTRWSAVAEEGPRPEPPSGSDPRFCQHHIRAMQVYYPTPMDKVKAITGLRHYFTHQS